MGSLFEHLEHWTRMQPDRNVYTFLDEDGSEREVCSYLALNERTRLVAAHLRGLGLKKGERVMLVYPPGLEFIVAFLACARAGLIAVPVYPPTPMSFEAGLLKLAFVTKDCGASTALTTRGFYRSYQLLLARRKISSIWKLAPALPKLEWHTTDDVRGMAPASWSDDPGDVLFLQYTSGSTSDPKGVIVTHDNVIRNGQSFLDHPPVTVSWLPQYHDMGLIGYYLFPMLMGGETTGFSPLTFLKRPALWLQTMSRVRATYASSPNFGFEYCLREDKLPDSALEGVDLSTLRVLMNAAEPVRAETYRRFYERFRKFGLPAQAHCVAFGLAENTLCVTNHGRNIVTVNKKLLQQRLLHLENPQGPAAGAELARPSGNQLEIVSCGPPIDGVEVRIVDPDTGIAKGEKQVGEIWLAGHSTSRGYWNRDELNATVFGNRLANHPDDTNPYLRTGDLGFMYEGELYVCGRIKDLIIIHGVNYYPQDIEAIVEGASKQVRRNGVAAFDTNEGGGGLVVVAEVRSADALPDAAEIARAIRSQYYVEPRALVFVPHGAVAKTTSGKISRSKTREKWLTGELKVLGLYESAVRAEAAGEYAGLRERFRYIVEVYNLTGREEYTLAEIGIDSLTMVQLLEDLKVLLEEHGAGALVEEVDLRLMQRLTVAEFFSMVDEFEKKAAEPLRALRFVLKRVQKENDEYERDCMRSDAELAAQTASVEPVERPITDVLMTGTTGFFGPFLLAGMLAKTPYTIHALTRGSDPAHGLDRIKAGMRRARILTPAMEQALEERVRVVCGDLSRHNLGLRFEQWDGLVDTVQAVLHNGALVNYVLNYDALRPHNVDGTREILRFAFTRAPKQFHLVSSTFIFGWTVKGVLWETDFNAEMANLDFGYAQSKWVAEQLVYEAGRQGLPIRVYRPSLISPSTGGVGSRDDIATRLLAFMIKYGVGVNALNQISFLPADIAADNIAAIFPQRVTPGNTFHVTVDDYYNMKDVTETITRDYGYAFRYFDIPEFIGEMNRLCTREDPLYPLIDFFNRSHRKLAAMAHKRYNNDRYRAVRALGGGVGDPRLPDTVAYLMKFMLHEGIVQPLGTRGAGPGYTDPRNQTYRPE